MKDTVFPSADHIVKKFIIISIIPFEAQFMNLTLFLFSFEVWLHWSKGGAGLYNIESPLKEDRSLVTDINRETSEINNELDQEVKDCVTGNYTFKEYYDDNGVYHFRLCLDSYESDESNWEVFDYGKDSALLDLEFMPEEI